VARKILTLAQLAGCAVCPHARQSDFLTAASLHLNAVLPQALFQEYNVCDDPIQRSLCTTPLRLEAGSLPCRKAGTWGRNQSEIMNRYRVKI
jgi:L-alanine-DL-glutamate epimerase-like enolase superfamily enzyme